VQEALLVRVVRSVLRAHGVVGAEAAEAQGVVEDACEPASDLDEPSQGPFGVGGAGEQENAVAGLARVDALPNGAGRVATLDGNGVDEQVRERMEKDVG